MIVRIVLLLVSLVLLVHGGEGLYRALHAETPVSPWLPAIESVAGAQALFISLFLVNKARRRRSSGPRVSSASARPPEAAETETPTPRIASAIRQPPPEFRRLMLVNLPPTAALSAIEEAPPLGAQPAVRSALARVLPGIKFNAHGLGQFNGADHSILMDLGDSPEVWSATIDVTGEAAAAALRRLITQTGWRAYAPRLGRFITSADLSASQSSPASASRP